MLNINLDGSMADETRRVYISDEDENPPSAAPARTMRVEGEAETFRVVEEPAESLLAAAGGHHPLGTLPPGRLLCGDIRVERTLYPHETQRPGLFLCAAPEGTVVVKVAAANYPPKAELWQKLVFLRHPHVLRTYRTSEEGGFFFEVQEYCTGGTLEARVPKPGTAIPAPPVEWVMETFVPQMNAALRYLHEQEIIHRDVKPANIYLHTTAGFEVLVLGDFDISSVRAKPHLTRYPAHRGHLVLHRPRSLSALCRRHRRRAPRAHHPRQRLLFPGHHHHRTAPRHHQPAPLPPARPLRFLPAGGTGGDSAGYSRAA